jgi:hypothetical protein
VGLGDITGVFSRYFVVGFFLPAYVSLLALWLAASSEFVPDVLEGHSEATQLLILGGIGLVIGLILSGLNYPIMRAFEGYPVMLLRNVPGLRRVVDGAIALQRRKYKRLLSVRDDKSRPISDRSQAAWRLDQRYPREGELLPTRMGNAIRAFERHPNVRWGLDGVTCWPRIETLLSAEERELHVDAKIDVNVFVNTAVGAVIVGLCLLVDKAVYTPNPPWDWPLYAIPFVLAYLLYGVALDPVVNWGSVVRASIDMHRLEMYEKLGVRAPTSFSDERQLATHLNRALLFGHPLMSDDFWRKAEDEAEAQSSTSREGLLSSVRRFLGAVRGKP